MIKAETIVHEGSPGPNWLEHCRAVITPKVVAGLVVIVAAAVIIISLTASHGTKPRSTEANSQLTGRTSLHVVPADGTGTSTTQESGSLQPANNAGDAALPGSSQSTLSTPGATSNTSSVDGPAPTNGNTTLQPQGSGLQQTTQTVQTVVNSAKALTNSIDSLLKF